jgi:hypothetical protein
LAPVGFFTSRIELNAALAVILPLAVATKAWTAGPIVRVESEKNDASGSPRPIRNRTARSSVLKAEIKLVPDQEFRGRALMVGRIFPEERVC